MPSEAPFHVVGLTGGIACGKSTVAAMLRERGYPVVDADRLAREVVRPGEPALSEIVDAFGPGVLDASGGLDRRAMGRVAFSDPASRRRLEAITHPAIARRSQEAFARYRSEGHGIVFYEAALLVETGGWRAFPVLVVVSAPPALQRERLMAREPELTAADAESRIASQTSLAEKEAVADFVIVNDGDLAALEAAVDATIASLRARLGHG